VIRTPSFSRLSFDRLLPLLQDDELNCEEVDLWNALKDWGKAEADRQSSRGDIKGSDEEQLQAVLKPLLKYIRFGVFSLEDIANHVAPMKLLADKELLQLYAWCALGPTERVPEMISFESKERRGGKQLRYHSLTDENGLIYYIGTSKKKKPFSNPGVTGEVLVRQSTRGGGAPEAVFDRVRASPVENSYDSDGSPWISVRFRDYHLRPTSYVIWQDRDHFLVNWRFEGRIGVSDGWTTIEERKSDRTLTSAASHAAVFHVTCQKFFQEFRISLTGPSDKGSMNYDITQLEFYGFQKSATGGEE